MHRNPVWTPLPRTHSSLQTWPPRTTTPTHTAHCHIHTHWIFNHAHLFLISHNHSSQYIRTLSTHSHLWSNAQCLVTWTYQAFILFSCYCSFDLVLFIIYLPFVFDFWMLCANQLTCACFWLSLYLMFLDPFASAFVRHLICIYIYLQPVSWQFYTERMTIFI